MNSLKHSMRQMFEERRADYGIRYGNTLEDGLLEKIINLSLLNERIFKAQPWRVIAVKSDEGKQRLYNLLNSAKVLDSAVILIILLPFNYSPIEKASANSQPVTISLTYAAKYYGVDCYPIYDFDPGIIAKEFDVGEGREIISIICLGYFSYLHPASLQTKNRSYSETVKEI